MSLTALTNVPASDVRKVGELFSYVLVVLFSKIESNLSL